MTLLRALAFHPKRTAEINQPVAPAVPMVTPAQTVNPAPVAATTPSQNLAQLKAQVEKRVPVQPVQAATPPVQVAQPSSPEISPALAAMQARKQLQEKQAQLAQTEKKKPEPIAKPVTPTKTGTNNLQSRLILNKPFCKNAHQNWWKKRSHFRVSKMNGAPLSMNSN